MIIVGTHLDQLKKSQVREAESSLQKVVEITAEIHQKDSTFPVVISTAMVSCTRGTNIGVVSQLIGGAFVELSSTCNHNPHLEALKPAPFPQSLLHLRQMISLHQDRGFCQIDDLLGMDINHEQGGQVSEESYSCILLLNELGAIVHFDEPTLRDLIILDPDWLTKVCHQFTFIATFISTI